MRNGTSGGSMTARGDRAQRDQLLALFQNEVSQLALALLRPLLCGDRTLRGLVGERGSLRREEAGIRLQLLCKVVSVASDGERPQHAKGVILWRVVRFHRLLFTLIRFQDMLPQQDVNMLQLLLDAILHVPVEPQGAFLLLDLLLGSLAPPSSSPRPCLAAVHINCLISR